MRFAAYCGASAALATAVVLHAFNQRPNFYSATVYLAQSQACRMIILNLAITAAYTLARGLQKLLYGPLRAIEREQLWDKSWYAITETALAMTTFRDEVGAYFMVMFVSLLAGKVWAWISESRVDTLEQQPPANPRLFHARLVASLVISELFDILMLRYCINTLLDQPRPGMMVMFAFEFAVLLITSTSIMARYLLSLWETWVMTSQTAARMEERREEIRTAREAAERVASETSTEVPSGLAREEDLDENDIDVPGWQDKGKWVLFLDLLTDFLKLIVYMLFFSMLLLFHGIPIHIIRDVYLTTRSFVKRISDFRKYQNATKDMNERYPDATVQELERDGTCIICREEMLAWQQPAAPQAGVAARPGRTPPDEKQRPKKLPCGHVLHLGCLRSWLERQQVCPTCRTSVLARGPTNNGGPNNPQQAPQAGAALLGGQQDGAARQEPRANEQQAQPALQHQMEQAGQNAQNGPNGHNAQGGPNAQNGFNIRARTFRIGPWRFTFAAGQAGHVMDQLRQLRPQAPAVGANQAQDAGIPNHVQLARHPASIQDQIARIEQQIVSEVHRLNLASQQLHQVRHLQQELERLRDESQPAMMPQFPHAPLPGRVVNGLIPPQVQVGGAGQMQETFRNNGQHAPIGAGHPDLPAGFTLPEGWTLLPLDAVPQPTPVRRYEAVNDPTRQMSQFVLPDVVAQAQPVHQPRNGEAVATDTAGAAPSPLIQQPAEESRSTDLGGQKAAGESSLQSPPASSIAARVEDDANADDGDIPDWSQGPSSSAPVGSQADGEQPGNGQDSR